NHQDRRYRVPIAFLLRRFNLKWFEWLLIGSIGLLLTTTYVQHRLLDSTRSTLVNTQIELRDLGVHLEYRIHLRDLDERTVNDLWRSTTQLDTTYRYINKEFYDAYYDLVHDDLLLSPVGSPTPTVDPLEDRRIEPPPP